MHDNSKVAGPPRDRDRGPPQDRRYDRIWLVSVAYRANLQRRSAVRPGMPRSWAEGGDVSKALDSGARDGVASLFDERGNVKQHQFPS